MLFLAVAPVLPCSTHFPSALEREQDEVSYAKLFPGCSTSQQQLGLDLNIQGQSDLMTGSGRCADTLRQRPDPRVGGAVSQG